MADDTTNLLGALAGSGYVIVQDGKTPIIRGGRLGNNQQVGAAQYGSIAVGIWLIDEPSLTLRSADGWVTATLGTSGQLFRVREIGPNGLSGVVLAPQATPADAALLLGLLTTGVIASGALAAGATTEAAIADVAGGSATTAERDLAEGETAATTESAGEGEGGTTEEGGTGTGKTPSLPTRLVQLVTPSVRTAIWNETTQGAQAQHALDWSRTTLRQTIPSQRQQLQHLSTRPIGG